MKRPSTPQLRENCTFKAPWNNLWINAHALSTGHFLGGLQLGTTLTNEFCRVAMGHFSRGIRDPLPLLRGSPPSIKLKLVTPKVIILEDKG